MVLYDESRETNIFSVLLIAIIVVVAFAADSLLITLGIWALSAIFKFAFSFWITFFIIVGIEIASVAFFYSCFTN